MGKYVLIALFVFFSITCQAEDYDALVKSIQEQKNLVASLEAYDKNSSDFQKDFATASQLTEILQKAKIDMRDILSGNVSHSCAASGTSDMEFLHGLNNMIDTCILDFALLKFSKRLWLCKDIK